MTVSIDRDLNDVLVFIQVVNSGSFTAAGKALHLPTSTVSRRVSRLEEQLGVRLLQRTTRKLSVTEAGQLYFERGRGCFAELEEAEHIIADAQANPRGRVRVTAPVDHSMSLRLVTSFLARYPDIRVDLELSNQSVNIIEEGYDVSISAGPMTNLSVVAHKLMESSFRIVASPDYIERWGQPESPQALSEHACVIFGPASSSATWSLGTVEDPVHVEVHGRIAVNHLAAVRDAVISGLGIGFMPEVACAADLGAGRLVELLPGAAPPPVPVWITHPAGRFLAPAVRAFVEHVRAEFVNTVLDESTAKTAKKPRRRKT